MFSNQKYLYHDNCYICLEKTDTYFQNNLCFCKIYCHEHCFNKIYYFNKCIICKKNIFNKNYSLSLNILLFFYYKIINFLVNFTIIKFYSKLELFINIFFTFILSIILFSLFSVFIYLFNYFSFNKKKSFNKFKILN